MFHDPEKTSFAFYSKNRGKKDAYAAWLIASVPHDFCLYLCPKASRAHLLKQFPGVYLVDIEKFTQKDCFLNLLSMITEKTLIIIENISRYTLISSDKFNCLQRIRMRSKNRYLIDIVPFTKDITKLYLPFSYLDREILQYSNGWAFLYNYAEQDASGRVRHAHDLDFLAEKIAPHCRQDYKQFLPEKWIVLTSKLTVSEHDGYADYKRELFEKFNNPGKIVTELCDFANMVDSRKEQLCDLIEEMDEAVIYTNICKNNPPIKRYLKSRGLLEGRNIEFRTYYAHDNKRIESKNVILYETPINSRFAMLDVIADIPEESNAYHFRNDAKADIYIYDLMNKELEAINGLTKETGRLQL